MISWFMLIMAIMLEVSATCLLKLSNGFKDLFLGTAAVTVYGGSLFVFSRALRTVPLGVAYAIWSGLGIVFVILLERFVFKQQPAPLAYGGILLIIAGTMMASLAGDIKG